MELPQVKQHQAMEKVIIDFFLNAERIMKDSTLIGINIMKNISQFNNNNQLKHGAHA